MPPLTPVVKKLLIVNIFVFVLVYVERSVLGSPLGLHRILPLYYPTSEFFQPYQLVSHFFMHADLTHIFFNMFGLVMFGPLLENRHGPQRFIALYLVAAAGAVALHFGYTWYQLEGYAATLEAFRTTPSLANFNAFFKGMNLEGLIMDNGERVTAIVENIQGNLAMGRELETTTRDAIGMMSEYLEYDRDIPMVGASGALYGVVAAFAIVYPDFKLMLIFLPIPIRARYFVPIMLAIDLFLGVMQFSWDPIAHFAHLGGAIAGGALAYIWYKKDPPAGTQRWN